MEEARKPIKCRFANGVFTPLGGYWQERAGDYQEGEIVTLSENIERTGRSHNHYFSVLKEAFDQLPEHVAVDVPSVSSLRKWALVETGYYNQRVCIFENSKQANQAMKFIRDGLDADEYIALSVAQNVLIERRSKSQSLKAMGTKAEFEKSKQDVLSFVAELIGISVEDLKKNTKKAA